MVSGATVRCSFLRNLAREEAEKGQESTAGAEKSRDGGGSVMEYLAEKLAGISFGRLPGKKDPAVSSDKRELVKGLRSRVKDTLQELREQFFTTPMALSLALPGAGADTGRTGHRIRAGVPGTETGKKADGFF